MLIVIIIIVVVIILIIINNNNIYNIFVWRNNLLSQLELPVIVIVLLEMNLENYIKESQSLWNLFH